MSVSYFLVCMDCKVGVHLGKAIHVTYFEGGPQTYGFGSLGTTGRGGWKFDEKGCSEVQHFLMLHRTHELRVLADNVDRYARDIGFPHSFPLNEEGEGGDPAYSRSVFFNTDVGHPDPEREIEKLPEELIEKLKTF